MKNKIDLKAALRKLHYLKKYSESESFIKTGDFIQPYCPWHDCLTNLLTKRHLNCNETKRIALPTKKQIKLQHLFRETFGVAVLFDSLVWF